MSKKIDVPDFDNMIGLTDIIKTCTYNKMKLDIEIKSAVADIIKTCKTNEKYFENGKPPAMSFVESTYAYQGFEGELIEKREKLADEVSKLAHAEILLRVYHDMVEVYRTQSANERIAIT